MRHESKNKKQNWQANHTRTAPVKNWVGGGVMEEARP